MINKPIHQILKSKMVKNTTNSPRAMNQLNRFDSNKKNKNQTQSYNILLNKYYNRENIQNNDKKYFYQQQLKKCHKTNNCFKNQFGVMNNNCKTIGQTKNENNPLLRKNNSQGYIDAYSNIIYNNVENTKTSVSNSNFERKNNFAGVINILIKYIDSLNKQFINYIMKDRVKRKKEIMDYKTQKEFLINENKKLKFKIFELLYIIKEYENNKKSLLEKYQTTIKQIIKENNFLRKINVKYLTNNFNSNSNSNQNNLNPKICHTRKKTQYKIDGQEKSDSLFGYLKDMKAKNLINKEKHSSQKNLLKQIKNQNENKNKDENNDKNNENNLSGFSELSNTDTIVHESEGNDKKEGNNNINLNAENNKSEDKIEEKSRLEQNLYYTSSVDKYSQRIEFTK